MGSIYVRQPNGKISLVECDSCTAMFISINLAERQIEVGKHIWPVKVFNSLVDLVKKVHGEKMHAKVMELANEQTTWTAKLMEVDDVSSACQPPN